VPDGVLFGSSNAHRDLRKLLLKKCQLEGIVSMPSGVFKPYAGVSTAVLIFTKGGSTEKVWFYDMEADGYSLDDKRTPLDRKGDIPDIIEQFRKRREENSTNKKGKCFHVPATEIKTNNYDLSISRYKEIEYEEIRYEKPEIIIEKIEELEGKILENIDELNSCLTKKHNIQYKLCSPAFAQELKYLFFSFFSRVFENFLFILLTFCSAQES
jgi:type I restriction enzyme M protein